MSFRATSAGKVDGTNSEAAERPSEQHLQASKVSGTNSEAAERPSEQHLQPAKVSAMFSEGGEASHGPLFDSRKHA